MLVGKIFSLLVACVCLVCLLMALSTDYWLVVYGAKATAHSGLWQTCLEGHCFAPAEVDAYIVATRAFLILASLAALASTVSLVISFTQCPLHSVRGPLIASFTAFMAGVCVLIALTVYTTESWGNKDASIQRTYEWSFYLAWVAFPSLLLTGIFSLLLYMRSPAYGYENL